MLSKERCGKRTCLHSLEITLQESRDTDKRAQWEHGWNAGHNDSIDRMRKRLDYHAVDCSVLHTNDYFERVSTKLFYRVICFCMPLVYQFLVSFVQSIVCALRIVASVI